MSKAPDMQPANPSRRHACFSLAAVPLALTVAGKAAAHTGAPEASAASSLSLSLPVAVLVAAPVAFLFAGAVLTVTAIEASAHGAVWIVRRSSDGVTASLAVSGELAASVAVGVGTAISVTAVAAGWLLSAAGEVLCIVPNALGESLLYNERVR
ncbi:MAG: hypothetical protein L6Q60_02175 [Rhodocyclaceae bacterium]|nr:hypothetical protein [Rhodocyclaceae bacterium]